MEVKKRESMLRKPLIMEVERIVLYAAGNCDEDWLIDTICEQVKRTNSFLIIKTHPRDRRYKIFKDAIRKHRVPTLLIKELEIL